MTRETLATKARRYVGEGRLVLHHVDRDRVTAAVRGDGAVYELIWTPAHRMAVHVPGPGPLLPPPGRRLGRGRRRAPRRPSSRAPYRGGPPVSWTASSAEPSPLARVREARVHVDRLRRLVAEGKEGASALAAAEWTLHLALRDLKRQPLVEDDDGPEAA